MPTTSDSSSLMPDTGGINFYSVDHDLAFLLRRHLAAHEFERAQPILMRLGLVASREMDELAAVADRARPTLTQFDRKGQHIDEIVFHPAYHELERIAYEDFAIAACCHREGAMGWPGRVPQPIKFALGYLGMQAEIGYLLPRLDDRCARSRAGALRQRATAAPLPAGLNGADHRRIAAGSYVSNGEAGWLGCRPDRYHCEAPRVRCRRA